MDIVNITSPADDPVLGSNGYPHVIEEARIKSWPFEKMSDLMALMDYVRERWKYPDYWDEEDVADDIVPGHTLREYRVSTGGWSGNEDLIGALESNVMFAMVARWSWRRGGHYVYRIPYDR